MDVHLSAPVPATAPGASTVGHWTFSGEAGGKLS